MLRSTPRSSQEVPSLSTTVSSSIVDLTGQVALVTGGGGGLGRAFALALASAGAAVAVTGRSAAPLAETAAMIERAGGQALPAPGDVAVSAAVTSIVSSTESRLGPIDILVNNAGVMGPLGYDWDVDPDDWWGTFEINVRGSFLCTRAVLAGMVERKRGRIVNISSGAATRHFPQMAVYGATKAALTQWTTGLATELQGRGVNVFAFAPGFVRTPMTERLTASADVPKPTGDFFREFLNAGRVTPIVRSAQVLLFLVSGRADALSGRFIHVRDNEEALAQRAEEIRRDNLHVLSIRT
jgi:NAD(P)-dependent dehydrogenase (short-subunit alcohol dehydrogenase family)